MNMLNKTDKLTQAKNTINTNTKSIFSFKKFKKFTLSCLIKFIHDNKNFSIRQIKYKRLFKTLFEVQNDLNELVVAKLKNLCVDSKIIISGLKVINEYQIAFSHLNKIQIIDLKSLKCINTIEEKSSINCFEKYKDKLITGCDENKKKLWDIDNSNKYKYKEVETTKSSQKQLLITKNNKIIAGSIDNIEIWVQDSNLNNNYYKKLKEIKIQLKDNRPNKNFNKYIFVEMIEDLIVIGNTKSISILDIKNDMLTSLHYGYSSAIINLDDNKIAFASWGKIIEIMDITTGKIIRTLTEHFANVLCLLKLDDELIASGSKDTHIRILELENWNLYKGFNSP